MVHIIVDIDDADAPRVHGMRVARQQWIDDQLSRIAQLGADLGALPFTWRSRGGLKFLVPLRDAVLLDPTEEHWRWWSQKYIFFVVQLWERYGLVADASCKPPTALFRLPQVTRNGEFVRYATWGALSQGPTLDLYSVPAPSASGVLAAQRLATRYPGTWPKAVKELVVSRPKHSRRPHRALSLVPISGDHVPPALVAELATQVSRHDDGRHSLYLQLAGALCQLHVPDVTQIVHAVAFAAADPKVLSRCDDARSTVRRFETGRPIVGFDQLCEDFPDVAAVLTTYISALSQRELEVRNELQGRPLPVPLQVNLARTRFLLAALEAVEENQATIIATPTGVGKTAGAVNIALAASSERKVAMLCPSNVVAEEVHANLGHSVAKRRLGVLATRRSDGSAVCAHATIAKALERGGYSVRQTLCPTCAHKHGCTAKADFVGASTAGIEVGNHALIEKSLAAIGPAGLLILDEMPPVTESMTLTAKTADALTGLFAPGMLDHRYAAAVAPVALAFGDLLRSGVRSGDPIDGLLTTIATRAQLASEAAAACTASEFSSSGAPVDDVLKAFLWATTHYHTPAPTSASLHRLISSGGGLASRLSVLSRVLSFLSDGLRQSAGFRWADRWTKAETENEPGAVPILVGTRLNPRLVRALSHPGPLLILDATPDVQAVRALCSRPVATVNVDAHDGAPVHRTILTASRANRRWMLRSGTPSVALVLIDKALATLPDVQTVLLITYKTLIDELGERRTPWLEHFRTGGRRLLTAHYGHVRGQT